MTKKMWFSTYMFNSSKIVKVNWDHRLTCTDWEIKQAINQSSKTLDLKDIDIMTKCSGTIDV